MKKRGFTLVELLAVIIILSIIIVITVPIISGLIDDSRREAFRNNVINLFDAVKQLESEGKYKLDEIGISSTDNRLSLTNNPFTGGTIKLDDNNIAYSDKVTDGTYCALGHKKDFVVLKGSCELSSILSNIKIEPTPDNSKWSEGKKVTITLPDLTDDEQEMYDISFSVMEINSTEQKIFKELTEQETNLYFGHYVSGNEDVTAKDFYKNTYGYDFSNNLDKANLLIKVANKFGEEQSIVYQILMVDSTAPESVSLKLVKRNVQSMYVMADAIENDSYIKSYSFKIDGGSWINNGTNSLMKFDDLEQNKTYTVTVKVENAVGLTTELTREFEPAQLEMPEIEITPVANEDEWVKERTAVITYPADRKDVSETEKNNYVYQYKIVPKGESAESVPYTTFPASSCNEITDKMGNVYCKTGGIAVTQESNVIATVSVGETHNTHTVPATQIDSKDPIINGTGYYVDNDEIRVHIDAEDNESGIDKYECSKDNGSTWSSAEGSMCNFTGLSANTSYNNIKIKVTDKAGNDVDKDMSITTLTSAPDITLTPQADGVYKKVKITFPNLGDLATYSYKVGTGAWTETTSSTVTTSRITANDTVVYAKVEYAENVFSKTITIDIDKEKPSISFNKTSNSSWTTSDSIKVTATDNFGFGTFKYIWSTSKTATPTSTFTNGQSISTPSTASGTYYLSVQVCDSYNNCETKTSGAFYLDNEDPSCDGTYQTGVSTSVTGYVYCDDDYSGCERSSYYGTYSSNGYKNIYIYDNVGNYNICSIYISNVQTDTTGPTCTVSYSTTASTTGSVTVTATCKDNTGGTGCTQTTKSTTVSANGSGSFTFYDYAGNSGSCTYKVSNIVKYSANQSTSGTGSTVGPSNSKFYVYLGLKETAKYPTYSRIAYRCYISVTKGNFYNSTGTTNWGDKNFTLNGPGTYEDSGWVDWKNGTYGTPVSTSCWAKYTGNSGTTYQSTATASLTPKM